MSYAVNTAVNQVLSRLGVNADSPIAELASGTGPAATPTVTTAAQIIEFLTEGARDLVRRGKVDLYESGSVALTAGQRKVLYSALTMTTTGRRMFEARSASVNDVAVALADRSWYETHNPTIASDATGTPLRFYPEEDGVLLAPRPSGTWTLVVYGRCLPKDAAAGQNFDGTPDRWVPAIVEYAVARVAAKQGSERWDRFAAASLAEYERMVA